MTTTTAANTITAVVAATVTITAVVTATVTITAGHLNLTNSSTHVGQILETASAIILTTAISAAAVTTAISTPAVKTAATAMKVTSGHQNITNNSSQPGQILETTATINNNISC